MLNGLDLFSGIGGISIALSPWVRTVAYCEIDRYCQGLLLSRMRTGDIDRAPIWNDVQTLQAGNLGRIDIITGGFPCQDISCAGRGVGLAGERSGLFFEIVRLVGNIRPRFIFLENVPAITLRGLDRVLLELTALGYDCRWTTVSAAELGAPHLRERWFLLAHANGDRIRDKSDRQSERTNSHEPLDDGPSEPLANSENNGTGWREQFEGGREETRNVANATSERCGKAGRLRRVKSEKRSAGGGEAVENSDRNGLEESRDPRRRLARDITNSSAWTTEPNVGRVVDGLPLRVDRIRGLGNSVVPLQAREAFERLCGLK